MIASAQNIGDVKLIAGRVEGADGNALQTLVGDLRDQVGDGYVCVLGSADMDAGKVMMCASVSDDLIGKGIQAGKLVGQVARLVGGGGGGRPQLATAGGKQPENLDSALDAVPGILSEMLG